MSVLLKKMKKHRVASLLTLLFLLFPVFMYVAHSRIIFTASDARSYTPTLVIDAGHGGVDSGAIAADGTKESDLNLAIALKLRALAEFYGKDNFMIRQDDVTLSDSPDYSEHRDLQHRVELVNTCTNSIYVSIHQNCYPTGQPSGTLVIYSSQAESEEFGKLTHSNLIAGLNPDNRRIAEPAHDKYYILSHLECPAILVECGFMSNFSDMESLKTPAYQTSIAAILMGSFLQYTQNSRYI